MDLEGNEQIQQRRRLDFRKRVKERHRSALAWNLAREGDTACSRESGHCQKDRMAHLSTHLGHFARRRENVKVVQELMRHASTRFTLEIYSQAQLVAKRAAQRLVEAILPEEVVDSPPLVLAETA